jgi:hypothetical protein
LYHRHYKDYPSSRDLSDRYGRVVATVPSFFRTFEEILIIIDNG